MRARGADFLGSAYPAVTSTPPQCCLLHPASHFGTVGVSVTASKALYLATNMALVLALGVFFERPAHAYTDPGSSLLMFQSISAAVTGALFFFRRRLRLLFTRSRPQGEDTKSSD